MCDEQNVLACKLHLLRTPAQSDASSTLYYRLRIPLYVCENASTGSGKKKKSCLGKFQGPFLTSNALGVPSRRTIMAAYLATGFV